MNFTYKQIWLINFPVMMSLLMEQLINLTDTVFLGHVGEIELGASALAGMYYIAIYMLGFGFSLGLQVVVARRNGEGNLAQTGEIFWQGLQFLVCISDTGIQGVLRRNNPNQGTDGKLHPVSDHQRGFKLPAHFRSMRFPALGHSRSGHRLLFG